MQTINMGLDKVSRALLVNCFFKTTTTTIAAAIASIDVGYG